MGASLDLHITMLTLSVILTLRLALTIQPYLNPNPTNSNHADPSQIIGIYCSLHHNLAEEQSVLHCVKTVDQQISKKHK